MMMDTLQLSDIKQEERSSLYYGEYQYKVRFYLLGVNRTYFSNNILEFEKFIKKAELQGWYKDTPGKLPYIHSEIERYLDFKQKYYRRGSKTNKISLMHDGKDYIKFYTNDIAIVEEACRLNFLGFTVAQSVVTLDPGVMLFTRQPEFKYRVYFKEKSIDQEFKKSILEFLNNYEGVKASESLRFWLHRGSAKSKYFSRWGDLWLRSSHFIQFNEPGIYMVLILLLGKDKIGKYYELRQREMINTT